MVVTEPICEVDRVVGEGIRGGTREVAVNALPYIVAVING